MLANDTCVNCLGSYIIFYVTAIFDMQQVSEARGSSLSESAVCSSCTTIQSNTHRQLTSIIVTLINCVTLPCLYNNVSAGL